jgi:hypothetical protein
LTDSPSADLVVGIAALRLALENRLAGIGIEKKHIYISLLLIHIYICILLVYIHTHTHTSIYV